MLEKFLSVAVPPAPCKSGSQITSIYLCHSITSTSWKASKLQKTEIFIISLPLKMRCCWSTQVYTVQPFGFHEGLYVPQIASQEKSSADNGQAKLSPPFHLRSSGQYVKCTGTANTSHLSFRGYSPVDFYMFFYRPELLEKQRKVQSVGTAKLAETTRLSISLLPFSEAGRQGHWRLKIGDWNRDSILTRSWTQTESPRNLFWWKCNHRES